MMKKRAKEKFQLAPLTSSIAIASVVIYFFGSISLLVGIYFLISVFVPSGVFMAFDGTTSGHAAFALLGLIFCGISLYAAHELRRMEKAAAVLGVLICLLVISLSGAILAPDFSRYFLQPVYLNLIWLWPLPIAVPIIIWRNWGKMQWREDRPWFFGKTAKREKEGSEEL